MGFNAFFGISQKSMKLKLNKSYRVISNIQML